MTQMQDVYIVNRRIKFKGIKGHKLVMWMGKKETKKAQRIGYHREFKTNSKSKNKKTHKSASRRAK
jgi:hypothetical protein